MVKDIVKDVLFLYQLSERYDESIHKHLIDDLLDTANAHKETCVGLAAIQIGYPVKLICVRMGDNFVVMKNPVITNRSGGTYVTKESCLSLEGEKWVQRHNKITCMYTDVNNKIVKRNYSGLTAQIIQHEGDHLKGILI